MGIKLRFNSLKVRVLVWFASLVAVILFIFSLFLYFSLNSSINLKIEHSLLNVASDLKYAIERKESLVKVLQKREFLPYEIAVIKDAKIIGQKGESDFIKLLGIVGANKFKTVENGDYINAIYTLKLSNNSGKIVVYKKDIDDKIENIVTTMFVSETIVLLLLVWLGSSLIDKILFTLRSITKTAQNISVDNFSSTIPLPKYDDETRELVLAFNEMVHRLREGTSKIESFNSDVSHELKTPLTVIRGEIEVATLKPRDAQYYQKILDTIDTEASQIQEITENLLLLTRYTKENIQKSFALCSLDILLLQTIEKFSTKIDEKKIQFHVLKLENIELKSNETLIRSIFLNLIDNAIKYSFNRTNISISLFRKNRKAHFIIEDEGCGIAADKLDKITDRFYRVDESRSRRVKGFGLGLSIVKNSIELLNGNLYIESKAAKGTRVEVVL